MASKALIKRFVKQSLLPEWRIVSIDWLTEWMKDPKHPRKNPRQRFATVKVKHRKRRSVRRKLIYVTATGLIAYGSQEQVRRMAKKKERSKKILVSRLAPVSS